MKPITREQYIKIGKKMESKKKEERRKLLTRNNKIAESIADRISKKINKREKESMEIALPLMSEVNECVLIEQKLSERYPYLNFECRGVEAKYDMGKPTVRVRWSLKEKDE